MILSDKAVVLFATAYFYVINFLKVNIFCFKSEHYLSR